jgi:hypothetical protein
MKIHSAALELFHSYEQMEELSELDKQLASL